MDLSEKLALWTKITGIDPTEENRSYTIHLNGRMGTYDIKKMNDKIKEILAFDQDGIFTEAYLQYCLDQYLGDREFSIKELLENDDCKVFLQDAKTLKEELEKNNTAQDIFKSAYHAMDFYGLQYDQLGVIDIIELTASTEKCINNLKLMQFSCGKTEKNGFKVGKDIFMYRNLNDVLLDHVHGNIDGVSLIYICNPSMPTESYFSFVVKNGENLYLLSDMPRHAYPGQEKCSRCPGRDMSRRIESNWFPYDSVAGIDTSDLWGRGRYGISSDADRLMIPDENLSVKIGDFQSLDQQSAFWIIMMVSKIKEKFYNETPPVLPLSYTGDMIKSPLIAVSETALAIQDSLPVLELGRVGQEDTDDLKYDEWYEKKNKWQSHRYDYLIERFKDQIDESVFNIMASDPVSDRLIADNRIKDSFDHDLGSKYIAFSKDICGTKDEIEYTQKWIARKNHSVKIQELVDKEFEQKHSEIREMIRNRIQDRLKELILLGLQGKLAGRELVRKGFGEEYSENDRNLFSYCTYDFYYDMSYRRHNEMFFSKEINHGYNKADVRSFFSGDKAGVVFQIKQRTLEDILLLCDWTKDDLPEELRHYDSANYYYGNSLLDNIDPMATIKDPFNEMRFGVDIVISKKEFLTFCEEAGVEKNRFWLKKETEK